MCVCVQGIKNDFVYFPLWSMCVCVCIGVCVQGIKNDFVYFPLQSIFRTIIACRVRLHCYSAFISLSCGSLCLLLGNILALTLPAPLWPLTHAWLRWPASRLVTTLPRSEAGIYDVSPLSGIWGLPVWSHFYIYLLSCSSAESCHFLILLAHLLISFSLFLKGFEPFVCFIA